MGVLRPLARRHGIVDVKDRGFLERTGLKVFSQETCLLGRHQQVEVSEGTRGDNARALTEVFVRRLHYLRYIFTTSSKVFLPALYSYSEIAPCLRSPCESKVTSPITPR
ncbi:hypothetical protein P3T25_004194 [Paraburkholderia sp. GAS32]|jgi:hypothetical protein